MFLLEIAIQNSYDIIFKNKSIDSFNSPHDCYFIHNPTEKPSIETMIEIYEHFNSIGDWNKCVRIKTRILKMKYNDTIKRLST